MCTVMMTGSLIQVSLYEVTIEVNQTIKIKRVYHYETNASYSYLSLEKLLQALINMYQFYCSNNI